MLPKRDSPLNRIPLVLDRRQVWFIDGIRYAIGMADFAYRALYRVANEETLRIAGAAGASAAATSPQNPDCHTEAVLSAWSMVDSINRLRELLDAMPGLKKNQPELQLFKRKTAEFETLRNAVQHLRDEISALAAAEQHVWGALGWISIMNPPEILRWCTLHSGVLYPGWKGPRGRPFSKPIDPPIDHLTLLAHGLSVSLTEAHKDLERLTGYLEHMVVESYARTLPPDPPVYGADMILCLELSK